MPSLRPATGTGYSASHCSGESRASVESTDGYVRVTYASKVVDLYVAGYPEPPLVQADTTRFVGYALMHSTGDSGCNLERAMRDAGACYGYGKE